MQSINPETEDRKAGEQLTTSAFLRLLFPDVAEDERIELRIRGRDGRFAQRWARDPEEAVKLAKPYLKSGDIFFGIGLRHGELGTKVGTTRLPALWADVDGKCFSRGKQGALDALDAFPLPPSVIVDTGHGYHAYWLLDELADAQLETSRVNASLEEIRRGLSAHAESPLDQVSDISRVLRLPWSFNQKDVPQKKPIRVTITRSTSRRYGLDELVPANFDETREEEDDLHRDSQGVDKIAVGRRKQAGFRVAGLFRRIGLSREGIAAGLGAINNTIFEKPLPGSDIEDMARSAAAYGTGMPPEPELADAAFQGLAGDITRTIAPHTEAGSVALLATLLTAFGNAVGSGPYVSVGAVRHSPRLFIVEVGGTSKARKGQGHAEIMRLFEATDRLWREEHVLSGLSTGEGLIHAVRDPVEEWDKRLQQMVVKDPGVSDKRLLVAEPEFARMLRVMSREQNTLSPVVRQAWDDGNLRIITKSSPEHATDAYISIVGHITGEELLMEFNATDAYSGFGNRFIWLRVERSKLLPFGGRVPEDELDRLALELQRAIDLARQRGEMRFTPEAAEIWSETYERLSEPQTGVVGGIVARAEAQTLRLALCYALLDGQDAIGVPHLEAANALWDYAAASVEAIFDDQAAKELAKRLYAKLRQGEMDRSDLYAATGRHARQPVMDRALALLQRLGLIESVRTEPPPHGGRQREVYRALHPDSDDGWEAMVDGSL